MAPQPASRRRATAAQTLAFAAEGGSSGVFDSLWRAGGSRGSGGDASNDGGREEGSCGAVAAEESLDSGGSLHSSRSRVEDYELGLRFGTTVPNGLEEPKLNQTKLILLTT
jgi:hypothetical protein